MKIKFLIFLNFAFFLFVSISNAQSDASQYLLLNDIPTIEIEIHTSNTYLAGSEDPIFATFKGDFAVSGPHLLGAFGDRVIGVIQQVILSIDGTDAWLYRFVGCKLLGFNYVLKGEQQWLAAYNPTSRKNYGDGYAAENNLYLARETLVLAVTDIVQIISDSGT